MDIESHRSHASQLSLGSSSDEILDAIIKNFVKHEFSTDIKIIDIGCGKGSLLKKISSFGYTNLSGCDYTQFSGPHFFNFFQHDCNKSFPEDIGTFDVILCSEVIEHLENPWAFIRNLRSLLNKSGHIFLTTPNPESFLSILTLIAKGYFNAFGPRDYPAHITPISKYEARNMLNQAKIENIEFTYITNGRVPGTSLKWKSFLPFVSGKRFSDNYLIHASV